MQRQFIACAFTGGGRTYTYHHDGDPVAIGDKVIVDTRHGHAMVTVVSIPDDAPPFETKAIIRKHVEEPHEESHHAR